MPVTYRIAAPPSSSSASQLDRSQRAVVEHDAGPLLVLAGPGTGKTTTLVEAVVHRLEHRRLRPDQVLVLTFSRKAAESLRQRIAARCSSAAMPVVATFHAYCFALIKRFAATVDARREPRLVSAPEQDVRLRELINGTRPDSSGGVDRVEWPAHLRAALGTRGFADEVRAVLSRARELGLDDLDLVNAGKRADRDDWAAVGRFFGEYLDVLDAEGVLDHAELVHRAVLLAESPAVRAQLRTELSFVAVDEYQDTDPSQVRLLQALAGDGRDLMVVGDPDQSIYGFRGADVRGLLRFPQDFRSGEGESARVAALDQTRRFGPTLLAASRRLVAGLGVPGSLPRDVFERFRFPTSAVAAEGDVDVLTTSSAGAELDHVAAVLRHAHLVDEVPWQQMAVLVRSGVRSLPAMRRALEAAGVPVEVAGDEIPLNREPAVRPLLLALRVASDPAALTSDTAVELLQSPLAGLDALGIRRLARGLGSVEMVSVRDALADPQQLEAVTPRLPEAVRGPALRLSRLLSRATELVRAGALIEDVLWHVWAGTGWPDQLRDAATTAHPSSPKARTAHHALDAVCALFDVAGRSVDSTGRRGVDSVLAQIDQTEIPAEHRAPHGARGDGVTLMTAHRAKGLEWRLVVVAGVQEGAWPDLRRRGSLLEPDRLGADGLAPAPTTAAVLAEERRLLYVAVTRATERLVITAVRAPDADGDQPSRFLSELGVDIRHVAGRPQRCLTPTSLVAQLRRVASDPASSTVLRRAAAARLARLDDDPQQWWGLRQPTQSDTPVRPTLEPLVLSASAISGLLECPLRWFLGREAAGTRPSGAAAAFGSLVHAIADEAVRGGSTDDSAALMEQADVVWGSMPFDAEWISERNRAELQAVLDRFLAWHHSRPPAVVDTEREFEVETTTPEGDRVVLRGSMDRLERDESGRMRVVDLKTSKVVGSRADAQAHPQLGVYQLAVLLAARQGLPGFEGATPDGAELVHLRQGLASGMPTVRAQAALQADDSGRTWVDLKISRAAAVLRSEQFAASPSPAACEHCEFVRICPTSAGGQEWTDV